MKEYVPMIISFSSVMAMLAFGLWYGFVAVPEQMGMILKSLETNPEHVNSLTCNDLEIAIASGYQQLALNPPIKLIEKLKEIAKDKECQFQRPDLWLDNYTPAVSGGNE